MSIESFIIAIHVVAAITITGLVLIQRGKGSEIGASFGGGASQTMFGSSGSGNFLTKSTTIMVVVFFITSLSLAVIAKQRADLTVQDNSLISGDIEQLTSELRQESQEPEEPVELPADDLPAVENNVDDVPSVETSEEQ